MTFTAINPTDVLAQKRAEAVRLESQFHALDFLKSAMQAPAGRAFLYSLLVDSGTWSLVDPADAASAGVRNWGARLLERMVAVDPLAVSAMWGEAMLQLANERAGKKQ